jgi:SAM-dependent methyltransferase
MAHAQQLKFVELTAGFFNLVQRSDLKVLEIGSYIVNESVRKFFPTSAYTGVDLIPGPGVDIVSDGRKLKFDDKTFDLAISCECFEHNPHWMESFKEMHRMTREGGLIVVSCASRGRIEHGTTRTSNSSPGTRSLNWNYYRNLKKSDFLRNFDLATMFSKRILLYNELSKDLYFVGTKSCDNGRLLFDWQESDLLSELTRINEYTRPTAKVPAAIQWLWRLNAVPLLVASYLPDHIYQNVAIPYSKCMAEVRSASRRILGVKD